MANDLIASESAQSSADGRVRGGISRRGLLAGAGGAAILMGLGALRLLPAEALVRPPGGQDESRLVSLCVRCERCLEACPRDVIVPAHLESGVLNVRTPSLSFDASYCNWCTEENGGVPLCVRACPTSALDPEAAAREKGVILGRAELNEDLCLAHRSVVCRNCHDACPYEAMGLDASGRPYVIEEKCNGCGACEQACTSMKNASITAGATERAIVVRAVEGEVGKRA